MHLQRWVKIGDAVVRDHFDLWPFLLGCPSIPGLFEASCWISSAHWVKITLSTRSMPQNFVHIYLTDIASILQVSLRDSSQTWFFFTNGFTTVKSDSLCSKQHFMDFVIYLVLHLDYFYCRYLVFMFMFIKTNGQGLASWFVRTKRVSECDFCEKMT